MITVQHGSSLNIHAAEDEQFPELKVEFIELSDDACDNQVFLAANCSNG